MNDPKIPWQEAVRIMDEGKELGLNSIEFENVFMRAVDEGFSHARFTTAARNAIFKTEPSLDVLSKASFGDALEAWNREGKPPMDADGWHLVGFILGFSARQKYERNKAQA